MVVNSTYMEYIRDKLIQCVRIKRNNSDRVMFALANNTWALFTFDKNRWNPKRLRWRCLSLFEIVLTMPLKNSTNNRYRFWYNCELVRLKRECTHTLHSSLPHTSTVPPTRCQQTCFIQAKFESVHCPHTNLSCFRTHGSRSLSISRYIIPLSQIYIHVLVHSLLTQYLLFSITYTTQIAHSDTHNHTHTHSSFILRIIYSI